MSHEGFDCICVTDVRQLLQQFATFLVEHFADSRIVSNGE